ncbi:hypothetical protein [Streptomyces californicus]|uniref:hypothetical protein n=1 Tax=Streptomyces californicus TaxID=67351 RepID=UPI0004BFF0BF|nr:hypothetical protein [Streptomyces californicus]QRV53482.1 hypothetical protein I6J40_04175 [Streptomyces californicus]
MADLVAAGAPELPSGWFYRVKSDGLGFLEVEIRQHRKRFGSRLLASAYVREDEPNGRRAVGAACRAALRTIHAEGEHARRLRQASLLLGDHDPRGGR